MNLSNSTIIREIVKTNYKTASVFDEYNIDFCCGGGVDLKIASEKANVSVEELTQKLKLAIDQEDPDSTYIDSLGLDELSDYIIKRHHSYVSKNIPFIKQKLEKVCNAHGDKYPELLEIRDLFDTGSNQLTMHMQKEELILFPYIKKMVRAKLKLETVSESSFGNIQNPIDQMMEEHQNEGDRFAKIAELSNGYSLPVDACNTFMVTYNKLREFEQDLHRHVHLENNILFPKSIELEKEILKI